MTEQIVVQKKSFDSLEEKRDIKELQKAFAGDEGKRFQQNIDSVEKRDPELAEKLREALDDIRHGRMHRVA